MKKIVLGILIVFIAMGIVAAAQADSLKAPSGYEDMMGTGVSNKLDNREVFVYVGEMEFNQGIFDSNENQTVTLMEDNMYKFSDTSLNECGVQEKVKMDGKEYLVSIVDESTSDGDFNSYLTTLKEFNNLNHLIPLKVE